MMEGRVNLTIHDFCSSGESLPLCFPDVQRAIYSDVRGYLIYAFPFSILLSMIKIVIIIHRIENASFYVYKTFLVLCTVHK
jgi:hypothetical protein